MSGRPGGLCAPALLLLRIHPFERRKGGWRFGCRRISDTVVAQLVDAGSAVIEGGQVRLVDPEAGA